MCKWYISDIVSFLNITLCYNYEAIRVSKRRFLQVVPLYVLVKKHRSSHFKYARYLGLWSHYSVCLRNKKVVWDTHLFWKPEFRPYTPWSAGVFDNNHCKADFGIHCLHFSLIFKSLENYLAHLSFPAGLWFNLYLRLYPSRSWISTLFVLEIEYRLSRC
jgi:hypothetical protein